MTIRLTYKQVIARCMFSISLGTTVVLRVYSGDHWIFISIVFILALIGILISIKHHENKFFFRLKFLLSQLRVRKNELAGSIPQMETELQNQIDELNRTCEHEAQIAIQKELQSYENIITYCVDKKEQVANRLEEAHIKVVFHQKKTEQSFQNEIDRRNHVLFTPQKFIEKIFKS